MAKISIIVPTYNRCDFLKETIESILNQSFQDFEIIITDNDSSDDTEKVVRLFNDERIIYKKNEKNIGSVLNYNEALKLATGEYIHLFSDDDRMLDDCLDKKVDILNRYPNVGIVHSDINIIDQNGAVTSNEHYSFKIYKKMGRKHMVSKAFDGRAYHKYLFVNNIVCMPAVMMRRTVIDKIGYFDGELSYIVDWQYWLKASLFFDFYYINQKLISYRVHSSNTVKKLSIKILEQELDHIWNDLKANYQSAMIIKSKAHLFLLKVYYKANHRHFYTYPLRRLIESFTKDRYLAPLSDELKFFLKRMFKRENK
jgi:glycosyltransferase involved in cell wall biosynthesis